MHISCSSVELVCNYSFNMFLRVMEQTMSDTKHLFKDYLSNTERYLHVKMIRQTEIQYKSTISALVSTRTASLFHLRN